MGLRPMLPSDHGQRAKIVFQLSLLPFLLKYLLGYPNVRNYDGSWNEWSHLV
ncbi:rhodanese-like domain-containing protein [Nostoc commune]|uniref:rhodanese-like domain-containing protein n=1 Tax=Nostoc commune TaxID=1178 RepID=UPI002B20A1CA|nr:rhodanese-like domain-containing protein [Nostoc commune]